MKCQANLHQLGVGMLDFESAHGCLPPGIGSFPGPNSGPQCPGVFIAPLYRQIRCTNAREQLQPWVQSHIRMVSIKTLICDSDPIFNDNVYQGTSWGVSCYAGNA